MILLRRGSASSSTLPYAVAGLGRLGALGATSEAVARELLRGVLAELSEGEALQIGWVVGEQQWAIETPWSAPCRSGSGAIIPGASPLAAPYLPNGFFG